MVIYSPLTNHILAIQNEAFSFSFVVFGFSVPGTDGFEPRFHFVSRI